MLHLEGTKNERALVIVLAYVIGFVTAAMWFGFAVVEHGEVVTTQYDEVSSVLTKTSTAVPVASAAEGETTVMYIDGRLQLLVHDQPVILSVSSDQVEPMEVEQIVTPQGQGVHNSLAAFTLNESKQYLFFCESNEAGSCDAYVYDVEENLIHPIRFDGKLTEVANSQASTAEWLDSQLVLGVYHSTGEPWLLTEGE